MTKVIVGDEIGDPSKKYRLGEDGFYEPSQIFGFGLSVPDSFKKYSTIRVQLGEFGDIKEILPPKKVKELKTRRLPYKFQKFVARMIRSRSKSYAFVIDKSREKPIGYDDYSSSECMIALAFYSIEKILDTIKDRYILVILDDHSAYHQHWVDPFIKMKIETYRQYMGKEVRIIFGRSSSGRFANPLQTVDAVAYATLNDVERGRPTLRNDAKIDVHILDNSESIVQPGMLDYKIMSKNRRGVFPPRYGIYSIVEVL